MYDLFSMKAFQFEKDFLWGTSTAGHQIEGNNIYSNNWADEQKRPVDKTGIYKPSGMACDHWNRINEDIELMKQIGAPAYRMSIEWSRIEPEEGWFDAKAIDHYLSELTKLKESGFTVFVTLHHFTHPLWFDKKGGFVNLDNRKYFERYLEKILPVYSPFVDGWNVFNEINGGISIKACSFKMAIMRYHALGYHLIKKYSDAPVSTAHALVMREPQRRYDKFDSTMAEYRDCCENEFFFHAVRTGEVVLPFCDAYYDPDIKGSADYWAVNIYTRDMVDARHADLSGKRYDHKKLKMIPMDFYLEEFFPETVIHMLSRLTDKPVYITENGCSCLDDDWRIVWITVYLSALHEASRMGVDLRGYFYWSLMDNYEWTSFVPRFGLIDVNFDTFERRLKKSAFFYRDIVKNNGFSQEILRRYLNEIPGRAE